MSQIQIIYLNLFLTVFNLITCTNPLAATIQENSPITTTTTGVVKGKSIKVDNKYEIVSFLGIPYAEPPLKTNRFKKPIPVKSWEGVLDATKKPSSCMQITNKDFDWVAKENQNEDCLYLNLWVPNKFCNFASGKATLYLPIMVWLHGGGFWSGSSSLELYDGAVLSAYGNVIVASLNYRVGPFGFLYSGTSDAPGNMGLHDQVMAMEWIKNNAQNFCGDPSRITIFGNSAGSMSVGLHLISPLSRNLFTRAIMQSGSPYHPNFALDPNFIKLKDNQFATALGCANESNSILSNPETVIGCLRNMNAEHILQAESVVLQRVPLSFFPIHGDDFLPKSPLEAINSENIKNSEILIGNNKDEGSIFLNYMMPEIFDRHHQPNLTLAAARQIIQSMFEQNIKPSAKEIADFYLNDLSEENSSEILKAIHNSFGDFGFVCPSVFLAEKLANENDVFFYLFTHDSNKTKWGDWVGVGHFEEVPFVFGEPLKSNSNYTKEECRFSYDVMQKWTCFARNGKPIEDSNEKWPDYSLNNQYYEIKPNSQEIGKDLHKEACNFWRSYL